MALYFTSEQKNEVRTHLEQAREFLGEERDESRRNLLKRSQAALVDALLCVEADAEAIAVVVILDRVEFTRMNAAQLAMFFWRKERA